MIAAFSILSILAFRAFSFIRSRILKIPGIAITITNEISTRTAKSSTRVNPLFFIVPPYKPSKAFINMFAKSELKYSNSMLVTRNGPNGSIPSSPLTLIYMAYGKARNDAKMI